MQIPNSESAEISPGKLRLYLLSREHPVGRFKAAFFAGLGFTDANWRDLEGALLAHVRSEPAESLGSGPYGEKYRIRSTLQGPAGSALVDAIWILGSSGRPQFVTAYPSE